MPDEELLRIAISYLHGLEVPEFVKLSLDDILKNKAGEYYLRLANEKFHFIIEFKGEYMS
ncbi:hypothetical protein [Thiomicrorhabdus sp. Kp2]|uniref:hypothetical protein n=1 Tax=Thiomicrorhabdus sp. Kp2 TaxID=1123518 RepID=UPI0005948A9B|nr:hypothetical protein [Thiomicrorhabdus sp. Kp2]